VNKPRRSAWPSSGSGWVLVAIEELARKVAYHDRGRNRALRVVPGGVVFRAGIDFAAPWLDYF
jgi:hypothetical protein